ncbi:uncharacterized protein LOC131206340 isoform X2 [Anopheles bellator]|uniref:uncharacterized protein LOC131206340 isoform X2 n=1 Tax=Anopheles bellator TaxID=139047 RepID=UPI0026471629|nr:uncharacterized protein LOC131206340 isoform X2 [Anopheles bellator]
MPCERCKVNFGLMTRKKSCYECRRLFCRNCLSKGGERSLCQNCAIFTKRPLSRTDLAPLKVRDLIFYLQSKHISTSGCVEKDDLINLVIAHVNSGGSSPRTQGSFSPTSSTTGSASGGSSRYGSFYRSGTKNCSNTFDQIKSTCQNLFSNFTDKFNGVPDAGGGLNGRQNGFSPHEEQRHIFSQPRFGSNNVYNVDPGSVSRNAADDLPPEAATEGNQRVPMESETFSATERSAAGSSGASSSGTTSGADSSAASSSFSSPYREAPAPVDPKKGARQVLNDRIENILALEPNGTGCECCSEDEEENASTKQPPPGTSGEDELPRRSKFSRRSVSQTNLLHFDGAGPSQTSGSNLTTHLKPESKSASPSSSFDELLAYGERSSSTADHVAPTETVPSADTDALMATGTSMDTDQWQIVNSSDVNGTHEVVSELAMTDNTAMDNEVASNESLSQSDNKPKLYIPLGQSPSNAALPAFTRRRSDSYLLSASTAERRSGGTAVEQLGSGSMQTIAGGSLAPRVTSTVNIEAIPSSSHHSTNGGMCLRCGKRRNGIRRQLKKFRRQLEAATGASEADKRRQLEAFLSYLERRSKGSVELTDTDSITEEASVSEDADGARRDRRGTMDEGVEGAQALPSEQAEDEGAGFDVQHSNHEQTVDDSVCTNLYSSGNLQLINMKQIKLSDIKESADLDVLSVKQLKGILMVNRVDFKGCCEKAELRERVLRLWRDYKSIPSIEMLTSDDLCKICMDAPIECVILECGHMTTCTACGKVLSECPICRQYIVRVVRFFRA